MFSRDRSINNQINPREALSENQGVALPRERMASQTVQVAEQIPRRRTRLPFIDFARGIVMALVAWDHASDFWNEVPGGGSSVEAHPFYLFLGTLREFQSVALKCLARKTICPTCTA